MPVIIIGAGILAIIFSMVFMYIFVRNIVRRGIQKGVQSAQERYAGQTIHLLLENVNFYGQQSQRLKQVRGNGTLAIASDELYFVRWIPQKEYIVPLRDIESVEIVKSFLGKTNFRPLLKINFRNAEGESDAMAWLVKDPYNLKDQLKAHIRDTS